MSWCHFRLRRPLTFLHSAFPCSVHEVPLGNERRRGGGAGRAHPLRRRVLIRAVLHPHHPAHVYGPRGLHDEPEAHTVRAFWGVVRVLPGVSGVGIIFTDTFYTRTVVFFELAAWSWVFR